MFGKSGLWRWRNVARFGLAAVGVYLWYGGRLGPPQCKFTEVSRDRQDGFVELVLAASGRTSAGSLRRKIEDVASRFDGVARLRIKVVEGDVDRVRRALEGSSREYLARHTVATYERTGSSELFIDTHRLEKAERLPARQRLVVGVQAG
jgi:hypothetical protein